ncbi:flavodoxin I [Pelagirhabdus alkalitolerans]|uniref:Flavodoxin I n=1 Tax=Pelagirhabdus alkalitolerans TaxID=1612202 RepID=A0A1G6JL48_9BACI|nr:flavodoxin domain-containing protein [Pelagirhabdus alkalitolerans]SDC19391.1 flavodoxin I [Pelagirhabdus alkalitolerans]
MKTIIIYSTRTGQTAQIAEEIKEEMQSYTQDVSLYQLGVDDILAYDLIGADLVFFGTYTAGQGDLPFEAEDFSFELSEEDLTNVPVALFGSCDSDYPIYGGAIDEIGETFKSVGAKVHPDYLKIELFTIDEEMDRLKQFVKTVYHTYQSEV